MYLIEQFIVKQWNCDGDIHPDKYKDCIVIFGIFHMIMMYLDIIGKTFSDAGLKDLIIQSDVVATGPFEENIEC